MKKLETLLSGKRGMFHASFMGRELGELVTIPEIKGFYESPELSIHAVDDFTRTLRGTPEAKVKIKLSLRDISEGFFLLTQEEIPVGELKLYRDGCGGSFELVFPSAELTLQWEYHGSETGYHIIDLHFLSVKDDNGRIFYFSGT